jgi:FkbM family methyltransferase
MILIKYDPFCGVKIKGKMFYLPFSHTLPLFAAENPYFDTAIERLASFARKTHGFLSYVDIGANIGDTILFVNPEMNDTVLAIEADLRYFKCLKANIGGKVNIFLCNTICSSGNKNALLATKRSGGTAFLIKTETVKQKTETLDDILKNYIEMKDVNLIKVDTDGHDFEVIKGAMETISGKKPALLFECDDFKRISFVDELIEVFGLLGNAGYQKAILYDNHGYMHSVIKIDDKESYIISILHKLIISNYYFDVVVMQPGHFEMFLKNEVAVYSALVPGGRNINHIIQHQ